MPSSFRWSSAAVYSIVVFLSIFGLILFSPPQAAAKGKPHQKKKISGWIFSASTWLSTGQTDLNIAPSSRFSGNPASELIYQDIDAYTAELSAEFRLKKWFFRGLVGYGGVSGTLIDDDYISAEAAAFFSTSISGEHRFSRSQGDVEDEDLLYASFDVGRYFFVTKMFRFRGYLGYQFLIEELASLGHTQIECTSSFLCRPVGVQLGAGMHSISNTNEWHAMKLGVSVSMHVLKKLKMELDGAFLPLAFLENEDIHFFRTDLSQSPSAASASQGLGYNLEATLIYNVWSRFFIKAGYRFWKLQVEDGVTTFFRADGTTRKIALNEFNSYRHGAVVGLELRF